MNHINIATSIKTSHISTRCQINTSHFHTLQKATTKSETGEILDELFQLSQRGLVTSTNKTHGGEQLLDKLKHKNV